MKSFRMSIVFVTLLMGASEDVLFAKTPLFSVILNPLTSPIFNLSPTETGTVQYLITNQSPTPHTMVMSPIPGVSVVMTAITATTPTSTSCYAKQYQSCTLSLQLNGAQIPSVVRGGPKICHLDSKYLCYGPMDAADVLKITPTTSLGSTLYAGAQNGVVYYSVDKGLHWSTTIAPSLNQAINSIFVTSNMLYVGSQDGHVYYSANQGVQWRSTIAPSPGQAVNSVFFISNKLYVGSMDGSIYVTTNGSTWTNLGSPDGSSVNGIYVISPNIMYAGTQNGSVWYSNNGGATWAAINGQPDGSAVEDVFVANGGIYVNTTNEYVYFSPNVIGGGTWTTYAQSVYHFFVNNDASIIDAGTQGGYVFSLIDGNELGSPAYSPINSVYVVN